MTGTEALGAVASAMGTALAIAPVLQMRLIVRNQTSQGVSIGYAAVLLVAMTLWLGYGLALGSATIIVPNLVSVLVSAALITTIWRFREQTPARALRTDRLTPGLARVEVEERAA